MEPLPVHQLNILSEGSKTSKYFLIMKIFYKMLHILICLDLGFFEHKQYKTRIMLKLISTIRAIFMIFMCLLFIERGDNLIITWISVYLLNYIAHVLILVFFDSNNTFCKLFHDLEAIDVLLRANTASYNIEKKLLISVVLDFGFRLIVHGIVCLSKNTCVKPFVSGVIILLTNTSLDAVYIACAFVFYSIYSRLKKLTSILITGNNLTSMKHVYKSIVELTEIYKSAFQPLLLLPILFHTLDLMASILYLVYHILDGNSFGFQLEYLIMGIGLVHVFAPALCAGMVTSEVNNIRILLHNKLLQERDEAKSAEIESFVRYVDGRELRLRLYKVIPLDADLLGMVLNFAVTYLIVIIQFTNTK